MRISYIYTLVSCIFLIGLVTLLIHAEIPEKAIVGSWDEVQWEYEKKEYGYDSIEMSDNVKELLGKSLKIHEAESWRFLPNGKLVLINDKGQRRVVDWRLKGRGNILQIKHSDFIENFQITKLDEDQLILNFDNNVHVRGIARLTFSKST